MNLSSQNEDTRFLELLRKWQSGDFTRADEQEMNALAAGDEFRSEALEGFVNHTGQDHRATLDSLQRRIQGKKDIKRIALPQIVALAAALALIFGAIWFFNSGPIPKQTGTIAQDLPDPAAIQNELEPPGTATPVKPEESLSSEGLAANNAEARKSREKAPLAKQKSLESAKDDLADLDRQVSAAPAPETKASRQPQGPGVRMEQSTNASPAREMAEQSASQDAKKSEEEQAAYSYQDKAAKSKAPAKAAAPSNAPEGGWDEFRQFLRANARLTPEAKANNVSGSVRLEFKLDENNRPADFRVVKGLGYGCDEEAIRLVKSAVWLRGSNQTTTVDVLFVR